MHMDNKENMQRKETFFNAKSKKRRKWRDFLEENRKLVQFYDDHPETKKTRILTEAKEGYSVVLTK
jgi:hypothetical protein